MLKRALLTMLLLAGCEDSLNPTPAEVSSFGTEVYIAICNRVASSAYPGDVSGDLTRSTCVHGQPPPSWMGPRIKALHAERSRMIAGLDTAVSPELGSRLNEFHVGILPLYDEGLIAGPVRSAAGLMEGLSAAPVALESLARLSHRRGYLPADEGGLVRSILSYPRMGTMLPALSGVVGQGGSGEAEWKQLLYGLYYEARKPPASPPAPDEETTLSLLQDLLLQEDPGLHAQRERLVVRRDRRGIAMPRLVGGKLPPPFADRDGDGLADVDSLGRFLGADGSPIAIPPPFATPDESGGVVRDLHGRLLRSEGDAPVYQYLDASRTLLGGMLGEGRALMQSRPGLLFDLALPVRSLLGRRTQRVYTDPSDGQTWEYPGFDVTSSPLLDVAHAMGPALRKPAFRRTLLLFEELLKNHESEVAAVAGLVHDILSWTDDKSIDRGELEPGSNLTDDLVLGFAEMAKQPQLLENMMAAIEDPRTRDLGRFFAGFFRFKDQVTYNPDKINAKPINLSTAENPFTTLKTAVDRGQPNTKGNQSIFQRVLHLIHDSNGNRMCNKEGAQIQISKMIKYPFFGSYEKCKLLDISDMAVFLVQVLLDKAEMVFEDKLMDYIGGMGMPADLFFETKSGIVGFKKHPTPAGMFRMMFAPHNDFVKGIFDPILTKDGVPYTSRHKGTIFSWEQPGFYEALTPLLDAFYKNGHEHYFAELISVLHMHWSDPSCDTTQSGDPQAPAYSYQSGAVRYEELVARILDEGKALTKIGDLLGAAGEVQIEGVNGKQILVDLMRELLVAKKEGLTFRDGRTFAVKNDGTTQINELAPVWLLIDAIRKIGKDLDAEPERKKRFNGALRQLADRWLAVQEQNGKLLFADRQVPILGSHLIGFIRERIEAHQQDLGGWTQELESDLEETLAHPLVAVGLDFLAAVDRSPEARGELDQLIAYMMGSGGQAGVFDATVSGGANLLQALSDDGLGALARAMAPALDPERGLVRKMMLFLARAVARDPEHALSDTMRGLALRQPGGRGEMVLDVVGEIISRVNRARPELDGPLTIVDLKQVLDQVTLFLRDETSGLERMLRMVAAR